MPTWHCYLTNAVKGAERVDGRKTRTQADRDAEARVWAPVLAEQLHHGHPRLIVCLGAIAERMLDAQRPLLPPLPPVERVHHYSYIGNRPDRASGLGPMHPERIRAYHQDLARCAALAS